LGVLQQESIFGEARFMILQKDLRNIGNTKTILDRFMKECRCAGSSFVYGIVECSDLYRQERDLVKKKSMREHLQ